MVRPAMLLIILLAVSLSLTLFAVKYQVQDLEEELVGYNRGITENRQAIHVPQPGPFQHRLTLERQHSRRPCDLPAIPEKPDQ